MEDAQEKAIEILKNQCSYKKYSDIPSSGHSCAYKSLRAKYTVTGMIDESMNGVTNVQTPCDTLLPIVEEDWSLVLSKRMTIKDIIFDEYS